MKFLVVFYTILVTAIPCIVLGDQDIEPIILPGRLETVKVGQFSAQNEPLKTVVKRIDVLFFRAAPDFKSIKYFKPKSKDSIFDYPPGLANKSISFDFLGGNMMELINQFAQKNELKITYKTGNFICLGEVDLNSSKGISVKDSVLCSTEVRQFLKGVTVQDFSVSSVDLYAALEKLKKQVSSEKLKGKSLALTVQAQGNETKIKGYPIALNIKGATAYEILNLLGAAASLGEGIGQIQIKAEFKVP